MPKVKSLMVVTVDETKKYDCLRVGWLQRACLTFNTLSSHVREIGFGSSLCLCLGQKKYESKVC